MIATVLLALFFISAVSACSKRPPPPPPPPKGERKPAPPPPIVKVVRTQEQKVGFNKCVRKCDANTAVIDSSGNEVKQTTLQGKCGQPPKANTDGTYGAPVLEDSSPVAPPPGWKTTDGLNDCVGRSNCVYECTFKVYVEVALTIISKPTGCGCAFHMNIVNPRPARVVSTNIVAAQVAQEVTVGDFELVVWDHKANRVVEKVPEFKLPKSQATKDAIAKQVAGGNSADFTTVTAGFSGTVSAFPKLPASLNLNKEENFNHVPALSFEVTQIYADKKFYNAPPEPALHKPPNAYQSQCVPFWPKNPFCYNSKKRQTGPNAACNGEKITLYHKKFLLFPDEGVISAGVGETYTARLITAFYSDDDCRRDNGIFSIDSEFKGTLSATEEGAELALGTWSWARQFVDGQQGKSFNTHYIFGVPGRFSPVNEVFDKGYSTITWHSIHGFQFKAGDNHHKQVLDKQICQKFNPAASAPEKLPKYAEQGEFYKPQAGIRCAPFDDVLYTQGCGSELNPDHSLMAFLNDGEILNFNKKETSILIMGKMDSGCKASGYKETVFDTLTFTGVMPGLEPIRVRERSILEQEHDLAQFGLVYDEEAEGLVHGFSSRGSALLQQPHKRALADVIRDQVATPPNEESYDMRVAAGSADENGESGANAGDHPIDLFAETFSAPVNIDPQADAPVVVDAGVTTGSIRPTCNRGSIGCSCRVSSPKACDLGLKCDSNAKCMMQDCKPGQPGCPCANGACEGKNNECSDSICVTRTSCTVGEAGCECNGKNACTDGSSCTSGLCIRTGSCEEGSPGCVCGLSDMSCQGSLVCDPVMGSCLAPRCKSGEPGCRCNSDASCMKGFQCNLSSNVCSLLTCPAGDPGCQCTDDRGCNKVGFECRDYTTTGDSRCVAEPTKQCFDQTKRCVETCGQDNVKVCPSCTNGVVECIFEKTKQTLCELDPLNPNCKQDSSAASVAIAIMSVIVALVAAL